MFDLPTEVERFRGRVREFARERVAPGAGERDRKREFPAAIWKELGSLGWLGLIYPKDLGGAGLDFVHYIVLIEELAAVEAALALDVGAHCSLCAGHIWAAGSDEQKKKWIPRLASGQATGSWALTEPEAGSDAAGVRTRATVDGDGWRLDGEKCFITLGTQSHIQVVNASSDPEKGKDGISAFVVEKPAAGLEAKSDFATLGMCSSDTARIRLSGVRVPGDALIGRRGSALRDVKETLDGGRIGVGAVALGIARACLDASIAYAGKRKQFGKPIGQFQSVGNLLADMATDVEAARLLIYKAAFNRQAGRGSSLESSMVKMFASRTAVKAGDSAVQIHGGHGYTCEHPVERYWRDAKLTEIGEGTTQVQQIVIAKSLLGRT